MLTLNMRRGAMLVAKRGAVMAAKRGAVMAAIAGALTFTTAAVFAQAAQPIAPVVAAPATGITIKDVKVGSPVFGNDGAKIGAINRISADASGHVSEIYVAPGGVTGLDVPVIQVLGSQIASTGPNVKLSVSAEEAKKFPTGSNNSG